MISPALCWILIGRKLSPIVGGRRSQKSVIASQKSVNHDDGRIVGGGIELDIPLNFRQINWIAFPNGHVSAAKSKTIISIIRCGGEQTVMWSCYGLPRNRQEPSIATDFLNYYQGSELRSRYTWPQPSTGRGGWQTGQTNVGLPQQWTLRKTKINRALNPLAWQPDWVGYINSAFVHCYVHSTWKQFKLQCISRVCLSVGRVEETNHQCHHHYHTILTMSETNR